jgi:hypothetical protein
MAEAPGDGVMASLLYADRKTVELYDEALGKLPEDITSSLKRFRDDHETNAEKVGKFAEVEQGEPSDEMRVLEDDLKRVLRDARDEVNVLEALLLAERTNAILFRAADETEPPIDQSRLLAKHHEDQQRHTSFIESRIPEVERATSLDGASQGTRAMDEPSTSADGNNR